MPTEAKAKTIAAIKEACEKANGLIFTDYRGLSVKHISQLRRELKGADTSYQVVKNTLFRIGYGEGGGAIPTEYLEGPTAIAFVRSDEAATAKVLAEFQKHHPQLEFKGAYIGGKVYTAADVVKLSKLPSRETLIAQVIGLTIAPLNGIAGVVNELVAQVVRCVAAIEERKKTQAA